MPGLPPQTQPHTEGHVTVQIPHDDWPVDHRKCRDCGTLIGWTDTGWVTPYRAGNSWVCEDCLPTTNPFEGL